MKLDLKNIDNRMNDFVKRKEVKFLIIIFIVAVHIYVTWFINMINTGYKYDVNQLNILIASELTALDKSDYIFDKKRYKELLGVMLADGIDKELHQCYFFIMYCLTWASCVALLIALFKTYKCEYLEKEKE